MFNIDDIYRIEYSIPYIAVFLLFLFIAYISNKKKKSYTNLCLFIYIIFIGFRGYIGWDFFTYTETFERIIPFFSYNFFENFKEFDSRVAPGFTVLIAIFKIFSDSYIFFVLLLSVISVLSFKKLFLMYNIHIPLGFALLIIFGLNIQVDLLRNNLTIILFLFSLDSVLKSNIKSFIFYNLIGISIHLSSFLFLPLYFFLNRNIKKPVMILAILGSFVYFSNIDFNEIFSKIGFLLSNDIIYKLDNYSSIETYSSADVNVLLFLLKMFFLIIIIYCYNNIIKNYPKAILFLNLACLNILSFLYLSSFNVLHLRLQFLFILSFVFCIPYIYKSLVSNRFTLLKHNIVILFILFQCYSMTQRFNSILWKYENHLTKWDNLEERAIIFQNYAYEINPLKD